MNAPRPPQDPPGQARPKQAGSGAGSPRKTKGTAPAVRRVVLTEAEIDAPNRNTLIMLGVISLSTVLLWAAGRAACNYHVPGESLTPRAVSLEERTRFPKDVGIEFAQALSGASFSEARSLAQGEGVRLVDEAKQRCGACTEQAKSREELSSTAIVHHANSIDSIVEVKTYKGKQLIATRFLGIERTDRKWRVTRDFPHLEAAALKPPPFSLVAPPGVGVPGDETPTDASAHADGVAAPEASAQPLDVASAASASTGSPVAGPVPSASSQPGHTDRAPVLKLNLTGPSAPAEKPDQED